MSYKLENEFILYYYPDQLLNDVWVNWCENIFTKTHDSIYSTPTGFQDVLDGDNSNNRTRALECLKIGLLISPVVNQRGGSISSLPYGWELVQKGENVISRIGYISYIIGKIFLKKEDDIAIRKAFSVICTVFLLHIGFSYGDKKYHYISLFEWIKKSFPLHNSAKKIKWLRLLSSAMFSTIRSEYINEIIIPFQKGTKIKKLYLYNNDSIMEINESNYTKIIDDNTFSFTNIRPKKHSLFWIGSDTSHRGIYSYASEYCSQFIEQFSEVDIEKFIAGGEGIFKSVLRFNIQDKYSCVFEDTTALSDTSLLKEWDRLMKSLIDGVNEALNYLQFKADDTALSGGAGKNLVYYGPPGTGKSYKADMLTLGNSRTIVTFHPEFSYSDFVGSYKPVSLGDKIKYVFVPQNFIKAYVKAWSNLENPYFLVIEEINRGNCAQIFGDLLQLLDRDFDGFSKYFIDIDTELGNYLKEYFSSTEILEAYTNKISDLYFKRKHIHISEDEAFKVMILPKNLSLVATMNTSDQSLFPMDSAFKRRWEWQYVPIDYDDANNFKIIIGANKYSWSTFLKKINAMIYSSTHSEDKQLGNRFVNPKDKFIQKHEFVNKVMFYLWYEVYRDEAFDNSIFKYNKNGEVINFSYSDLHADEDDTILKGFLNFNNILPDNEDSI